jgi:hypothetical protein
MIHDTFQNLFTFVKCYIKEGVDDVAHILKQLSNIGEREYGKDSMQVKLLFELIRIDKPLSKTQSTLLPNIRPQSFESNVQMNVRLNTTSKTVKRKLFVDIPNTHAQCGKVQTGEVITVKKPKTARSTPNHKHKETKVKKQPFLSRERGLPKIVVDVFGEDIMAMFSLEKSIWKTSLDMTMLHGHLRISFPSIFADTQFRGKKPCGIFLDKN